MRTASVCAAPQLFAFKPDTWIRIESRLQPFALSRANFRLAFGKRRIRRQRHALQLAERIPGAFDVFLSLPEQREYRLHRLDVMEVVLLCDCSGLPDQSGRQQSSASLARDSGHLISLLFAAMSFS